MKKVTSISGGKTSAYLAAHYPADYLVFALVRTSDIRCAYPDKWIARLVERKIGKPFIGTLEDDTIICTILDLEQHLGQEIHWVSGITFDEVIEKGGGWLPGVKHRYCTTWMKIDPIFYWWSEMIGEPVEMQIGFRANETRRKNNMLSKLNEDGLSTYKASFELHEQGPHKGKNKWEEIAWRKPVFPLHEDQIYKDEIEAYWQDKEVRFAERNNCIGCFHRNPLLLNKMSRLHPNKFKWFASKEGKRYWRSDTSYEQIMNHTPQYELKFEDFSPCDSGHCGI